MEKPVSLKGSHAAVSAIHALAARAHRVAPATSGFACMECGHKFKTAKAAEKAAFGDNGCPKCGGSDIDLSK